MSRWRSNTTWHGKEASILSQKGRKSVSHVVLEGSHVAMEVQHDVARQGSEYFEAKREKKREPRRIGSQRCRVGSPTRRGSECKLGLS